MPQSRFILVALSMALAACMESPPASTVVDGGRASDAMVADAASATADAHLVSGSDAAAPGPADAGPADAGLDTRPIHVVVLGSSSAQGKNLDQPAYGGRVGGLVDRWSDRYQATLRLTRPGSVVDNFAVPGYATFSALPTGTAIPAMYRPRTGRPDPMANITRAIGVLPDAIIVNMPLNGELMAGESLDASIANLHTLQDAATAAGIELWICTSGPTLGADAAFTALLLESNRRIRTEFGDRVLDFFVARTLPDGSLDPALTLSDDAHPNAEGHRLMHDMVVAADIPSAVLP